jgi:hypothetical protein
MGNLGRARLLPSRVSAGQRLAVSARQGPRPPVSMGRRQYPLLRPIPTGLVPINPESYHHELMCAFVFGVPSRLDDPLARWRCLHLKEPD